MSDVYDIDSRRKDSACYLYVIQTVLRSDEDAHPYFVKVGISTSPNGRLQQLQTSSPRQLEICRVYKFHSRTVAARVETLTHAFLKKDRHAGEWFETDETVVAVAVFDAIVHLKLRGFLGLSLTDIGISDNEVTKYLLAADGDYARRWRFMP